MALYVWQCRECGEVTRKLLKSRPTLGTCCCGGVLWFVTRPHTQVLETLDNGVMPRRVERLKDIEELVKNRSTPDPEDGII